MYWSAAPDSNFQQSEGESTIVITYNTKRQFLIKKKKAMLFVIKKKVGEEGEIKLKTKGIITSEIYSDS